MKNLWEKRQAYSRELEGSCDCLIQKLSNIPGIERVILFSSYARGRRDLLTDLDILVVMRTNLSFPERLKLLYQALALPVDLDLLCYTPEELETAKESPFLRGFCGKGLFSMRRSPREEGKRWLDQAKEDLKWVRELLRLGGYHLVCFLAQQIAEKVIAVVEEELGYNGSGK